MMITKKTGAVAAKKDVAAVKSAEVVPKYVAGAEMIEKKKAKALPTDSGQMTYFVLSEEYLEALDALAAKEKMSRTAMIVELVGRHLARNKELNAEKPEEKTVYTRIPVEDLERLAELVGLDRRKRTDYIRGLVVSEIQLLVPDLEGESRG